MSETTMNALEMPPGREMDALVAEGVMDRRVGRVEIVNVDGSRPGLHPLCFVDVPHAVVSDLEHVPYYSTDISAAWEVVEAMKDRPGEVCKYLGFYIDSTTPEGAPRGYAVAFGKYVAGADAAPLAICRAALAAAQEAP